MAYFNKLEAFRVWSRWEKVLFLAKIPSKDSWNESANEANKEVESTIDHPFHNHTIIAGANPFVAFLIEMIEVMTFTYTVRAIKTCYKNKNYTAMVFRFFIGFTDWFCYFVQCGFPFFVLFMLFWMPYCY